MEYPRKVHPAQVLLPVFGAFFVLVMALAALRYAVSGEAPALGPIGEFGWTGVQIALWVLFALLIAGMVFAVVSGVVLPLINADKKSWFDPERWVRFDSEKALRERYARGQITRDEYLQVMADLEKERAPGPAAPP